MTATRVIDDHIELANIGTKTHTEIEGHIQGIGNYAFPAADGTVNQILETDGAGVLSFVNKPASFACGSLNACNLSDIGTRPHASLTGIGASDHHTKYLDAEAVAACDASNDFIERNVDNVVSANTSLTHTTTSIFPPTLWKTTVNTNQFAALMDVIQGRIRFTTKTYQQSYASINFPKLSLSGSDMSKVIGAFQFIKNPGVLDSFWHVNLIDSAGSEITPLILKYDRLIVKKLLFIETIKSGATQAGAGAAAKEVWKTSGHASLPDNVLLIGV